jgi:hypothetical protein
MKLVFIDYSAQYYGKAEGNPLPNKRSGKFVQIRNKDTEYLVLSPRGLAAYHANIAERFFLSMGITGTYNGKRDHYKVKNPSWVVAGGGVWEIDEGAGRLRLSGTSMAYGKFNARGLAGRLRSVSSLSGYDVRIDT